MIDNSYVPKDKEMPTHHSSGNSAFEAVSNLLIAQNALQVAQQSYNLVHSTTLFDYMR